jgi:hypothetical protein
VLVGIKGMASIRSLIFMTRLKPKGVCNRQGRAASKWNNPLLAEYPMFDASYPMYLADPNEKKGLLS